MVAGQVDPGDPVGLHEVDPKVADHKAVDRKAVDRKAVDRKAVGLVEVPLAAPAVPKVAIRYRYDRHHISHRAPPFSCLLYVSTIRMLQRRHLQPTGRDPNDALFSAVEAEAVAEPNQTSNFHSLSRTAADHSSSQVELYHGNARPGRRVELSLQLRNKAQKVLSDSHRASNPMRSPQTPVSPSLAQALCAARCEKVLQ